MVEIISEEQNRVKRTKTADTVSETSGTISNAPTYELYKSQKKKRKRKGMRNFLKIILENCPNMEIVNQVQEVQRVPYRINPRRNMPRHILINLTKTKYKGRILKAAREKQQVTYKGKPIHLTADLSAETLQARREWQDIYEVLKGKDLKPRLLYLTRISFKIDGEIKIYLDKQNLREFSTTKPALQQILKRLI